jgi:formate/nitrite transporter FocA (FNT family)
MINSEFKMAFYEEFIAGILFGFFVQIMILLIYPVIKNKIKQYVKK